MKIKTNKVIKAKEKPQKFVGRFSTEGNGLNFSDRTKWYLKKFIKENPNLPFELKTLLPESNTQRGFFEGGVLPLWVFLDNKDYKDSRIIKQYHEYSKQEFNSEIVVINGKPRKVACSTKNKLNQGFLERVIGYLEDNYGIDSSKVLDPKKYKHWHDAIFPYGGPETYIDYLVSVNVLKRP